MVFQPALTATISQTSNLPRAEAQMKWLPFRAGYSITLVYTVHSSVHQQWKATTNGEIHTDNTFNSLSPGGVIWYWVVIFQLILVIDCCGIFTEIALRLILQDLTDCISTLAQVMAWRHQATNHYQSQCWPIPMSPYGSLGPNYLNFQINLQGEDHVLIIKMSKSQNPWEIKLIIQYY